MIPSSGATSTVTMQADPTSIMDGAAPADQQKSQKPTKAPSEFIARLFRMINESDKDIISWTESGESFIIRDQNELASKYFNRYFKHKNFASFRKQLNLYGFQTSQPDKTNDLICYHRLFKRDGEARLHEIVRSSNAAGIGTGGVAARPNKRAAAAATQQQQQATVNNTTRPAASENGGGPNIQEIVQAAVKEEMEKFQRDLLQNQNHPFREQLKQILREEFEHLQARRTSPPFYGPFLPGQRENHIKREDPKNGVSAVAGTPFASRHTTPGNSRTSSPPGVKTTPAISISHIPTPLVKSSSNDSKSSVPPNGGLDALASEADRRLDMKKPKIEQTPAAIVRPSPKKGESPPTKSLALKRPFASLSNSSMEEEQRLEHSRRVHVIDAFNGGVCCSMAFFDKDGEYRLDKEFWCVGFSSAANGHRAACSLSALKNLEIRLGDMRVKRLGGQAKPPVQGFIARPGSVAALGQNRKNNISQQKLIYFNGWGTVVFYFQDRSWIKIRLGPFKSQNSFLDIVGMYRDPNTMHHWISEELVQAHPDLSLQLLEVSFHKLDITTMMFLT